MHNMSLWLKLHSFLNICHIIVDSSFPSQPLSDYVHASLDMRLLQKLNLFVLYAY